MAVQATDNSLAAQCCFPAVDPASFIMTPAAAARSLLIADKVMSNNFVSRNVLNVWRTNKVSPTLMTLHRWAGLLCGSCLVFIIFW